jgi:hypothetical protein
MWLRTYDITLVQQTFEVDCVTLLTVCKTNASGAGS